MSIHWNPVINILKKKQSDGDAINQIIVPFIQSKTFLKLISYPNKLSFVITRWRGDDVASGCSDIELFKVCNKLNIPLYINDNLHAKILRFNSEKIFISSCNITDKGLGISYDYNLEAGVFHTLSIQDEIMIKQLKETSRLVDLEIYEYVKKWKDSLINQEKIPSLVLPTIDNKSFSITSLPRVRSPIRFLECYFQNTFINQEEKENFLNDVINFLRNFNKGPKNIEKILKDNFKNTKIIIRIIENIKSRKSLRFGEMTSIVHSLCKDNPMPSRVDLKEIVNTLYNWLEYCFDEITWDIPGHRSQVLYWDKES